MTKNMGTVDKVVRTLLAAFFLIMVFSGQVSGMLASLLILLAAVFIITSLFSFCPLYRILGVSTCKRL